ncbi:MAG: type II secretion system F family protein [Chromatiaceae bacterium]|nr:type II secretion system F family protein [Chromatiaceae bacterium]
MDFFPIPAAVTATAGSVTRELARLVGAGVSLDRSLTILATVSDNTVERDLITRLIEDIRAGGTFCRCLFAPGCTIRASLHQHGKGGRRGWCVEYRTRPVGRLS